ncbi:hypothetical protein HPP92_006472 [Vanilla planifolia]|uniref:Uncharacterized protein n=1 Tax=Vanilla planifolia TaxID=51239 RepID=A0A835RL01_VANPL|nr:hypothetical protein HPP92_006733 [Vanilla planifolia]KAG0489609.1 hypothetical protein HPP92_006472 [Vanilla planifolia]
MRSPQTRHSARPSRTFVAAGGTDYPLEMDRGSHELPAPRWPEGGNPLAWTKWASRLVSELTTVLQLRQMFAEEEAAGGPPKKGEIHHHAGHRSVCVD